ncbi:Twin-arginine translocation protein TatA [Thermogutta terrifontis]|uniref:Sec-independent protein translocase protein TatA n=1 Tax=Thermogutta terrifontis TaxID=1331910 RepID=A0A286RK03_9BACT|nr:twin-arginine translocase TatA/TatE family subunit [Thermogutta terrifontis]ASV76276.1 Twin-arginine translocation protein TatA [Thermogutta terrifontis]
MISVLTVAQFSLPGGTEMLIVLIVALLLFGNRLPQVARSLGKSLNEFRKGMQGLEQELRSAINETPPPSPPRTQRPENEEDRQPPVAPKFIPPATPPEETPPPSKVAG